MPAKSESQRRLMGAALSYKRGNTKNVSKEIKKVSKSMSEKELEDYASKPTAKKSTK
ncbi:MAG: DUF3008 family protein [Odoribacter sp.]|nr:DUF3008 family protein [Odoribacter sp.]